jgi:hypothetical protein
MEDFFGVMSMLVIVITFAVGLVGLSHVSWVLPCIAVAALVTFIFLIKDILK